MKKLALCSALLCTCFMYPSISLAQETAKKQLELNKIFKSADIIPDGKLDAGEFDIYHFTAFGLMDTDQDGLLVKDECLKGCSKHQLWIDLKDIKEKELVKNEFSNAPYRFAAIDKNGSGDLDISEYLFFGRVRFQYLDQNNNGFIEETEFCSSYDPSLPCDYTE